MCVEGDAVEEMRKVLLSKEGVAPINIPPHAWANINLIRNSLKLIHAWWLWRLHALRWSLAGPADEWHTCWWGFEWHTCWCGFDLHT